MSTREELFDQILSEWKVKLMDKDQKYGGDVIAGAIRKSSVFITPQSSILSRINEKWNRILENPTDQSIIDEETFDIWGYVVLLEACRRLDTTSAGPTWQSSTSKPLGEVEVKDISLDSMRIKLDSDIPIGEQANILAKQAIEEAAQKRDSGEIQ